MLQSLETSTHGRDELLELFLNEHPKSYFNCFLKYLPNIDRFRLGNDWSYNFIQRFKTIEIFAQEVILQYEKALEENKEIKIKGYSDGIELKKLQIMFETLLNAIYSLCDNMAYIGWVLHPGIKRGFNVQRKNIQKYCDQYPNYEGYLKIIKECDWYHDVHTMRSEATHYLPGFVFYSDTGLGILYKDMISGGEPVEIIDIQEYVKKTISEIFEFVEKFGEYHVNTFIEEHHTAVYICGIPQPDSKGFLVGIREVTYLEYLNGEPGSCVNRDVPCPNKEFCPAYNKEKIPRDTTE